MRIQIDLDGTPVEFHRNWFTGWTKIRVSGAVHTLQDPMDPSTHFSLKLIRRWQCEVHAHVLTIEKERPRFLAGFRPQTYRILVDGKVVAERRGY